MQISQDPSTFNSTLQFSPAELAAIQQAAPYAMADRIAAKFIEVNGDKLLKDKRFMAEVKRLAMNRSATLIADMVEQQVAKALGIKEDE